MNFRFEHKDAVVRWSHDLIFLFCGQGSWLFSTWSSNLRCFFNVCDDQSYLKTDIYPGRVSFIVSCGLRCWLLIRFSIHWIRCRSLPLLHFPLLSFFFFLVVGFFGCLEGVGLFLLSNHSFSSLILTGKWRKYFLLFWASEQIKSYASAPLVCSLCSLIYRLIRLLSWVVCWHLRIISLCLCYSVSVFMCARACAKTVILIPATVNNITFVLLILPFCLAFITKCASGKSLTLSYALDRMLHIS